MKVGIDGNHMPGFKTRGCLKTLELAKELGFDGVIFKTALNLSPTLDLGEMREVRAFADELSLYIECGVGRVNPYNTAESPEVRSIGDGDYRLGIERMLQAARVIDCVEHWADTATSADKHYPYPFRIDRFRTDVEWSDQLAAIEKFLKSLAPVLRDLGSRIDVETHEETTSFEIVRIVEAVGPDVVGITFDTGNVIARGEDPIATAQRVAPYTHLTHLKDPILSFYELGLVRYVYPIGQGVVDWEKVLSILYEYNPDLGLSIEDHKGQTPLNIYDPSWQSMHPDMSVAELAELVRLAKVCEEKIKLAEIPDPIEYEAIPYENHWIERVQQSATHLNGIIEKNGFWGRKE